MKLDRNINESGMGKYALVKLRKLAEYRNTANALAIKEAINKLVELGILDWGAQNTESEFFVLRLKDKYARGPLCEYATAAELDGEWEYGEEVREMAARSGPANKWCKRPD